MAIDPSVLINLAAEYTGKPAFDKAEKATTKLQKTVKGLGKAFGVAFAASTVVNYSQKAVKAFAADEAAALRLTRAVDNLGIGFANPAISKYIANLERSSAIADDILRPAFQALLTTTGSLTKSQELLNNAIQISRASGIDLATVSQDLANGYVGITKGLKKYNTGLTTAELSSKSFADVLGVMLTKSAGAAQDYLGTTQYKMDALTLATGNASEIIGGGLVNAFARIAGGTEASDAQKAIEGVATGIAHITEATGAAIGAIPNLLKMLGNLPKNIFQGFAGKTAGVNITPTPTVTKTPTQLTAEKQAKLLAKLEADAAKRAKQLLAIQKKQSLAAAAKIKADKLAAENAAKLAKAGAMFDLDKIQIEAALKGKISDDEKLRLQLQQAILNEDATLADTLQKKLEASQRATAALQGQINGVKPLADPFSEWLKTLEDIAATLSKILGMPVNMTSSSIMNPNPNAAVGGPGAGTQTPISLVPTDPIPVIVEPNPTEPPATNNPFAGLGGNTGGFGFSLPSYLQSTIPQPAPITVNVTNQGSVIMQDEFVKAVGDAVVKTTSNGNNLYRPGGVVDLG